MSNSQKIVVVIDDDPEMRSAIAALASACEYDARTFDTAESFLVCASTCRASCLVIDIELPKLSGLELSRRLTADGHAFPIIFITGHDDAAMESQAIAAGGIAYLRKPFKGKTLVDAIKKAVEAD